MVAGAYRKTRKTVNAAFAFGYGNNVWRPIFCFSAYLLVAVCTTAIDTTQFHTYVLQGTPANGFFTVSVDGTPIASGYAGPCCPFRESHIRGRRDFRFKCRW